MSTQPITPPLVDDDRAVAPVIGVVILFGFLILTLSVYQVEVVPQQNAEVEFQHFEDARNDLVELRAGILQAGSIDQPQYQTVQLGTTYPTRVFSLNPPSPVGTLRTTQSYPITISNGSGTPAGTITIPTRFIQYRPGYNELDQPPTWYDASVLYVDARDEGGGIAVIEDQALVDDRKVQITALQNEFRRSGSGRMTVELRPAESVTGDIPTGDLTVTIPTRLSGQEYWDRADIPIEYNVTDDTNDDGVHNLSLETTSNNLTLDTVGLQDAPEEPTQSNNAVVGGPTGGDGGTGSDGGDGGTGSDGGDGGTGDTLPNRAVAFNDEDGDGVYDAGEPTYTESEAAQLDTSVDLVIERDISVNKVQIATQSVQLNDGARLDTQNELKLDVSGRINIETGTLLSDNKMTLESSSGGIDAQDATLESKNELKITANGGDIDLTGANADSDNKITLTASGRIDAQDATLESKNELKITANGGDLDISSGALISDNKITLSSSADINARDTEFQAQNQISVSPASSGTLFVNDNGGTREDGGTYIEDQNGAASEISLQQGSVDGTPEKGSVN